ncbi:MAG: adenylate/guanylate cyclase domain-containing protein [Rhodothermaceae bacterium]
MKFFDKFNNDSPFSDEYSSLLKKEIIESEKIKASIFAMAAFGMMIVQLFLYTFFFERIFGVFNSVTPFVIIFGFTVAIFIRETQIRRVLTNRIKKNRPITQKMQFINIVAEASIPSLVLIALLVFNNSYELLSSPLVYLYFLVIILSVLSLNFWMTFTAGFIGALQYTIISVIVLNSSDIPESTTFMSEAFIYVAKAGLIFISGCVGGTVGHLIKKRIYKSFKLSTERNNLFNMLGQQVSRDIAKELLKNNEDLEAKELFACVMFLDIRGFTPLVSKFKPDEIIKYQNEIFGFMIEKISRHNGLINQFLGDGYMATFGAPIQRGNVCQNAVNAALGIIQELEKLNETGKIPFTRVGIGLHAGDIVAGNVGTDLRKQYSISGNTVILASRIEQLTKTFESQLLISNEVFEHLDDKKELFTSLGEISVKGRTEPIEILKPV